MRYPALDKLNEQKRIFVMAYMRDFNAKKAGETAGFAPGSCYGVLAEVGVQEAIAEQMHDRMLRLRIDADWLLEEMKQVWMADVADIYYPKTNTLRPVHEWPDIWRKMTTGVQTTELFRGRGENRELVGYSKKVKSLKESKLLELIGKHINIKAFTEKIELATEKDLEDKLIAGRRRVMESRGKKLTFM